MRLPLEIVIVLAALSVSVMRDALRREESAPKRAAMGLTAVGGIMMAIAGRMPPSPGETGLSPFVTAGAMIVTGSLIARYGLSFASLVEKILFRRRREDQER
jgi:multisubunit Na+/H+ antiporter MnhB subunit